MLKNIKIMKTIIMAGIILLISFRSFAQEYQLIDKDATQETKNLYQNLFKLLDKGVMFGHQDDLAYGVNWKYQNGRSDIHDIVKDYPAVFGWEISKIEHKADKNIDGVPFDKMKAYIKTVYDNGGVNTISWHMDNPATLGSAWDNSQAVSSVLPGGKNNKRFRKWLKQGAKFMKHLKGSDGKHIPILFRPWHEFNGGWFWWGRDSTSVEDYKALFKYTVDYLKNKKGLHNLIYMYNTCNLANESDFTERYPGDDYADMVSFDAYQSGQKNAPDSMIRKSSLNYKNELKHQVSLMDSFAVVHHKIPAVAEMGFVTIPDSTWWTNVVYDALKNQKVSYVLVWRNLGWDIKEKDFHYFAPYQGHQSAPDFKKYYDLPGSLFLNDIKKDNLYK